MKGLRAKGVLDMTIIKYGRNNEYEEDVDEEDLEAAGKMHDKMFNREISVNTVIRTWVKLKYPAKDLKPFLEELGF